MDKRFLAAILTLFASLATADEIANPLIDYDAFKNGVALVGELREGHRVTEREFLKMSKDPATVILDARSSEKFALLHISGAKNLSLPDITEEELAKIIPSKSTRILIYCNNNFRNDPFAFPSKTPSASLNIHTLNVLYAYGYKNVYELGPLIDIRKSLLSFERNERTASVQ